MKKFVILFSVLLVLTFAVAGFGCDQAETIIDQADDIKNKVDDIKDKVDDMASSVTPDPDNNDVGSAGSPAVDINSWIKVNTGKWEQTDEGVKTYGAGFRFGHQGIQSKTNYDFTDSETFIKWKANGGANNEYGAFWVFLMSDYDPETAETSGLARGGFFTTVHSWKESVVIDVDTWYYTRIKVNPDNSYNAVTATGDYDSSGGTSIYTGTGTYQNANNGKIVVIFQDNYGGTETYQVVGEVKTSAGEVSASGVTPGPTSADEKTVLIWFCEGVRNAEINGDTPLPVGQDNRVTIKISQPLLAEFDYTDSYGREQHARVDLDSYYDYFVLLGNGGWAQNKFQNAYESDKSTCQATTPITTPPPVTDPAGLGRNPSALAFDGTYIWVTTKGNSSLNKLGGTDGVLLDTFSVGAGPSDVLFDGANIWVANQYDDTVMKVNPNNGAILGTYPVGDYPAAIEYDGENIWVANQKGGTISKLRASDGANLLTYPLPGGGKIPIDLIFDGTNLWVGCHWGYLMRYNVADDILIPSHDTGGHISGMAYDGESVRAVIWHEGSASPQVRKYSTSQWLWLGDYQLNEVDLPSDIAYDGSSFWVADSNENKVIKLPASYPSYQDERKVSMPEEEVTFQTGDGPADMIYANGYMWVANDRDDSVTMIPVN
ncbi:hypothetical protein ACFLWU_01825 [Chloroflexota bacterium]